MELVRVRNRQDRLAVIEKGVHQSPAASYDQLMSGQAYALKQFPIGRQAAGPCLDWAMPRPDKNTLVARPVAGKRDNRPVDGHVIESAKEAGRARDGGLSIS